jgi:hypothetical protein
MQLPSPNSKSFISAVGAVCLGLVVFLSYTLWPRTAPPGTVPVVGPADGKLPVPEDLITVPRLSDVDNEKLEQGQVVVIKVGEGEIRIEATKPGEQQ